MATMIDIIGSLVIGGLVLVMMLGFRGSLGATTDAQSFNQSVQENMRAVTDVLEFDFRKMGYGVSLESKVKSINDSTIAFYGDIDNRGGIDSVQYYFRSVKPANAHNPSIGTLYRVVNAHSPMAITSGITRFSILWYDRNGALKPAQLKDIRSFKVSLGIESDSPADSVRSGSTYRPVYSGVSWDRIIRPRNLR